MFGANKKSESSSPVPRKIKASSAPMGFVQAIEAIINGSKVRRLEWADEGEHCTMSGEWLSIFRNGKYHGWTISEGDMSAKDWVIVK